MKRKASTIDSFFSPLLKQSKTSQPEFQCQAKDVDKLCEDNSSLQPILCDSTSSEEQVSSSTLPNCSVSAQSETPDDVTSSTQPNSTPDGSRESTLSEVHLTTNSDFTDISTYAELPSLTDEQRYAVLTTDWKIPSKVTKSKATGRSFQSKWIVDYHGLVYSPRMDGAFCKFCVAFKQDSRGALSTKPFSNWKDAKEKFNAHFKGIVPKGRSSKYGGRGHEIHNKCRVFSEEFYCRMNNKSTVVTEMSSALKERIAKNVAVLGSVTKTVMLCGRQNLALRGDRDDAKYLKGTTNAGNFQALLDFRIDCGDTVLQEHFKTAPKNATYRSKTIQNELVSIIGSQIQQQIVNEVNRAGGWFSVSADEVQDVSNKEQLAICIRYADVNDKIQEKFMALHDVSGDTTGEALSVAILDVVRSLGLDPNRMRSQCYDGAGNMMGKVKGVATRIHERYPKALPFWCASHLLNRCVVAACDVTEVRNMMGVADKSKTSQPEFQCQAKDVDKLCEDNSSLQPILCDSTSSEEQVSSSTLPNCSVSAQSETPDDVTSSTQPNSTPDGSRESTLSEVHLTTNSDFTDISTYAELPSLTDEQRYAVLTTDWKIPSKVTKSKATGRSFQSKWIVDYHGLVYSPRMDGAFCKFCVAFKQDSRGALSTKPFSNWKDAKEKFNAHFKGIVPKGRSSKYGGRGHEIHNKCRVFSEEFYCRMNNKSTVVTEMSSALKERIAKNVAVLGSVTKTVMLCGRQNLALRGDRDDAKYLKGTTNAGNFQALLDFRIDCGDTVLQEHFKTAPKNATYRSKTIQNELVSIIGSQIQQQIVNEVNRAGGWFSVSADEVQDVSNKEQLAICIRYADVNDKIQEKFMALHDVSGDTTGEALSVAILDVVRSLGLDPNRMRSQCYDGAGNMMGKVKGVATRIHERYPKALPFWCASHLLNRCVVAACDVTEVRNMMGVADKCCRFFNLSSKRQTFLNAELENVENTTKRRKLKELCKTRWVQRHDAFEVFVDLYPSVVDTLNAILNEEKRPDAVTDTNGILHAITAFQFVATLVITLHCLSYIKTLSINLQGRTLDVLDALRNVQHVRDTINNKRDSIDQFHDSIFLEACNLAESVGVEPSIPRRCGRQTTRNNTPADTPSVYYKRTITIPFLDHLVQQFGERFTPLQERAATALLLVPPVAQDLDHTSLDYFKDDLPSPVTLQADIECWRQKWTDVEEPPTTLSGTLKACSKSMFPNIHTVLQIVSTFPVTSCECERSISTLGLVKTCLRS